ncbi:myo-inosose-2 dehydratase [Acidipropionibacterium jensenii]|uniref:myo-inosose-2 dehydratase n=1 Tax=Acidipropionibacterium jensenii TaxID=1749 RepID=UPI0026498D4B|nr:myo-inosose-2 dehydratase [Acidipropionibacterium jensenii]MDN5977794.1 myo-inosose-2 dehydratase [Acidipropionibacterium jensenii]MDN5996631.1 myo-inosose-2 dehydratase [Acidipropionibacterium jensenii]MDN6427136.1 myo-inosose-2 dehydratase [Acidipropionibacterium jensenii]MDN6441450.1 myo-inosose-2 dehydratase [Acidipropionibacterium jensenii]MDN6479696.1 myo-inosose-2 dehydratase [Acidipropionibacterium jensenii]
MSTIKLGIAPIGWTNDDMPSLGGDTTYQQILSEVALAGFQGTEIGNKYPKDPAVLKPQLEMRGIRIAAAWCGLHLTTEPYEKVEKEFIAFRDYMAALGADCINVAEQGHTIQGSRDIPIFDGKPTYTDQEWDNLTTGLDKLGDRAAEAGLIIAYHHHMGTGVQTTAEIDRLMDNTDPSKVKLLLDVGHLLFSGEDPQDIATRYADRIGHVHMKDVRPAMVAKAHDEHLSFLDSVLAGVFTIPGDGATDYGPLLKPVIDAGYHGWFMIEAEQDPALADPFVQALNARKYLHETFGL